MRSLPLPSVIRRSTLNEPLGALVVACVMTAVAPLRRMTTRQVTPLRFWSTSNSASRRPSSGLAFRLALEPPVQLPATRVSREFPPPPPLSSSLPPLASAAPGSAMPMTRPSAMVRVIFMSSLRSGKRSIVTLRETRSRSQWDLRPTGGLRRHRLRRLLGELLREAPDGVVDPRILVGLPVGDERGQAVAARLEQTLHRRAALVGRRAVPDEPALAERAELGADPPGVDAAVRGEGVRIACVALGGLHEQPRRAGGEVDLRGVDGALDERARALAADELRQLAHELTQRVARPR